MKCYKISILSIIFSLYCFTSIHAQQPSSLLALGDFAYENESYSLAQKHYKFYLDSLLKEGLVDSTLLEAVSFIEDSYLAENNLNGVEEFYLQLFDSIESWSTDHPTFFITLKGKLGSIYATYLEFKENEQYIKDLLEEAEDLLGKENSEYIRCMNIMGSYYTTVGRLDKAESFLIPVLKYWKKEDPKSKSYGFALNNLALNYLYKGEYEVAEPYFQKALPVVEAELGRQSETFAQILNNLAGVYWKMGRYEEAANFLKESIEIRASQIGRKHPKYLQSRNALAAVYLKALNFQEAVKIFEELKTILDELGQTETGFYPIVVNNLGSTYNELGFYEKALKCFNQSMILSSKVYGKDHPESAIALINKASSLVNLKRYEEALPLFLQSKEIRLKHTDERNPKIALVYNQLANCLMQMENWEEALEYLAKTFQSNTKDMVFKADFQDLLKQLPNAQFLNSVRAITSYEALLRYAAGTSNEEEYLKCLDLSMHYLNQLKSQQSFDQDKLTILTTMGRISEDVLTKLSTIPFAMKDAFQLIEFNKAMLIADALRAKALSAFGNLPDSLILREQELKKEQVELKKQLIEVRDDSLVSLLKQKINNNSQAIRNYQSELSKNYPKYYKSQYGNDKIKLDVLAEKLSPKSLLLQYYIGEEYLYIISLDQKATYSFYQEKLDQETLRKLVQTYRESLSDYEAIVDKAEESYQNYSQTAKALYDLLIAPLGDRLKGKNRLLIIPDKILGHIPFEALLQEKAPEYEEEAYQNLSYLVNDFEIYYNYSARLFLNSFTDRKEERGEGFLGFAASYKADLEEGELLTSRSPRLRGLRSILEDLPAAEEEVKALEEYFKGNFFFGDKANEKQFKTIAKDYKVIHLAMHGLLDNQYPIRSALAFTENGDTIEDNFLQAYEISQLQLNADLVVLSACETGFGKYQQGEGVMSLARSFMFAGVPSLLVSLWQVNDQSTAAIMKQYYEQLAKGVNKVKALQTAKLNYLKEAEGIAQHPAFWAAFIQLGNDQPIGIQRKNNPTAWTYLLLVGGIGLLLLVGGLLWWTQKRAA